MESKATQVFKNLAFAMMGTASIWLGTWVLNNSFLTGYFDWILHVGFYVLMFGLTLAFIAFLLAVAVSSMGFLILSVKALFSRKKNDDD